jgi:TolB-like protein/Tfp pilus assembly protein PilF
MKRCPQCNRVEADGALSFCRVDGTSLVEESRGDAETIRLDSASLENATSVLPHTTDAAAQRASGPTTVFVTQQPASTNKAKRRRLTIAVIVITLFAALSVVIYTRFSKKPNSSIESIAVLPFENRSGSSDSEYLSDGLADSLIYRLSQLPNLKVTPTSLVMRYRGKEADVLSVAKDLQVDALMSGRLTQRGDDLSISVQLIDTRNDKIIWAEQYERKMSDLLAIQREIAGAIAKQLQVKLAGENASLVTKRETENNEAYQLYLKGQYQLNKRTEQSLTKGVEYFREATKQDPGYALAYSGLADAYNHLGLWAMLPPNESFPRAKTAAEKALQLDNTLAEAHAAIAMTKFQYYWDFAGAELEYQQAIKLNPRYLPAHEWHAYHLYLSDPTRYDAAMQEVKTAQQLDPLSLPVSFQASSLLYFNRKYDEAIAELASIHDQDPNFTLGYGLLGAVYTKKKMPDKAVDAWLKGSSLEGQTVESAQVLRDAFKQSGINGYLRKHIELLQEESKGRYISPYFIAFDYAAMDEKDRAFEFLDKAYNERSSWLVELRVDPIWDLLRSDPRYADLLRRIGYRN